MKQNQNPVFTRGQRNIFCPYYKNCLDHAAKSHWDYWSCYTCHHKLEKTSFATNLLAESASMPYYNLSPEIHSKTNINY